MTVKPTEGASPAPDIQGNEGRRVGGRTTSSAAPLLAEKNGAGKQMSTESQGLDPYDAVIADLRAKREQYDLAIQLLETLRSVGSPLPLGGVVQIGSPSAGGLTTPTSPGAFLGMTIPDAAKKLLASRRQALGNAEIVAAFKAGGLHMNSADPINTVGSVLTRRFNTVGDIVRVGRGIWGLAEWYPNRSFKKKGATEEADKEKDEPADPMS